MTTNELLPALSALLKPHQILFGDALQQRTYHIWKMEEPLEALAVVLPETTEDVVAILKYCWKNQQEIVVHGGLTNLVGSTEVAPHQLVMAMERMNAIEEVDPESRTITAQSGAIVEALIDAAAEHDLLLPLNFGAKGSAQIGGAIATNAGGLRVFRYGMTRQMVLGLEAVLPDGRIVHAMKKILKDNSGYDLKQLFIGAEGTLGVVTKVILRLVEAPKARVSAFIGLEKYSDVIALLKYLEKNLSGSLTGFELMWQNTYQTMIATLNQQQPPLPADYPYYVFVESLGMDTQKEYDRLEDLIGHALENQRIADATLVNSDRDLNHLWQIREDVSILASQGAFDQHFDISLPIPKIGSLIDGIQSQLEAHPAVSHAFAFGHVADGNIHFIVGKNDDSEATRQAIDRIVYAPLKANKGSVSAEHGIGLHKKDYLQTSRSEVEIEVMNSLKQLFDPNGILNPGRII
ncbi:MAG: FAD-binding oxidoreductase [Flavobacteriaceae bacterium]